MPPTARFNGDEFIALTNAANPSSLFRVLSLVRNGAGIA